MISATLLATVYLAFVAKHFLCDYPFQLTWMVHGKEARSGWVGPLAAHAAVHAAGTLLVTLLFAPALWWLAAVDFTVHFLVDRSKATLTRRLRLEPSRAAFWWAMGADQALHQLTHFAFVLAIVQA